MVRDANARDGAAARAYRVDRLRQQHLTVRAIKHTLDGALGSRGAWLLEPYCGHAGQHRARARRRSTTIAETAQAGASQHGYQLCVHAIGDRANREVLNIFEAAFKANPDKNGNDLRWRIEHAQHLHPRRHPALRPARRDRVDAGRPLHLGRAVCRARRLGAKRAEEGAYVWQKLMKSGAVVTNGTDAPVEDVDPIASYYATVTRKARRTAACSTPTSG